MQGDPVLHQSSVLQGVFIPLCVSQYTLTCITTLWGHKYGYTLMQWGPSVPMGPKGFHNTSISI